MSAAKKKEALEAFFEMAWALPAATRRFGAEKLQVIYVALGGEGAVNYGARTPTNALAVLERAKKKGRY